MSQIEYDGITPYPLSVVVLCRHGVPVAEPDTRLTPVDCPLLHILVGDIEFALRTEELLEGEEAVDVDIVEYDVLGFVFAIQLEELGGVELAVHINMRP